MAATLRLADVRLLAGATLVAFPRCQRSGAPRGDGLGYSAVSVDDPRIGRDLSAGFKSLLEPLHVLRHLAGRLATDDEGDEQLSDPVTGEVDLDLTRDRELPATGSTVTATIARISFMISLVLPKIGWTRLSRQSSLSRRRSAGQCSRRPRPGSIWVSADRGGHPGDLGGDHPPGDRLAAWQLPRPVPTVPAGGARRVLVVKGMLPGPLGTLPASGSMHRWFPAMVTESPISISKRPSSCTNLVGAGGFEPPASRL